MALRSGGKRAYGGGRFSAYGPRPPLAALPFPRAAVSCSLLPCAPAEAHSSAALSLCCRRLLNWRPRRTVRPRCSLYHCFVQTYPFRCAFLPPRVWCVVLTSPQKRSYLPRFCHAPYGSTKKNDRAPTGVACRASQSFFLCFAHSYFWDLVKKQRACEQKHDC